VFLELAITMDAHSDITANVMNTGRLLEITIRHFLFLQNIFVKNYFIFYTFIWHLGP
jgi:hypothetical protein